MSEKTGKKQIDRFPFLFSFPFILSFSFFLSLSLSLSLRRRTFELNTRRGERRARERAREGSNA